jgi:hypothetical protein
VAFESLTEAMDAMRRASFQFGLSRLLGPFCLMLQILSGNT